MLALALVGLQQSAITLECRARPLAEVMTELSGASRMPLACAKALEREIVLLRVEKQPLAEIRSKLAIALDAKWRKDGDGLILARSEKRTKELQTEAAKRRRAEAITTLESLTKSLEKTPTARSRFEALKTAVQADTGDMDGPWVKSTVGFWVGKIALDFSPDMLASMVDLGDDITFATRPNKLQRPFSRAAEGYLASMISELQDLHDSAQDDQRTKEYFSSRLDPAKLKDTGKFLLTIYRMGRGWMFWFSAFDAAGKEVFTGYQSSYTAGIDPYGEADRLAKGAEERYVPMSPLVAELERIRDPHPEYSSFAEETPRVKPSAALREVLLNPEQSDPLSLWASEAVLALAGKKNVCARLPDGIEMAMRSCIAGGRINVGKFKVVAEKVGGFKMTEDSDWLIGAATNPIACESARFDRAALGRFLRTNDKAGRETVDSVARYFYEAGRQVVRYGFWHAYRKNFLRFGIDELQNWGAHRYEAFALLGSLAPSEKRDLLSGRLLRFGPTVGKRRELFFGVLKGAEVESDGGTALTDLFKVRSEWMAQVPLEQSELTLAEITQPILGHEARPELPRGFQERAVEPREFGSAHRSWEALDPSKLQKMRFGMRQQLVLRVKPHPALLFEDKFHLGQQLSEKAIPFVDLPEAIRKEVFMGYEEGRKAFLTRKGG